jgi:hypothetical protein
MVGEQQDNFSQLGEAAGASEPTDPDTRERLDLQQAISVEESDLLLRGQLAEFAKRLPSSDQT